MANTTIADELLALVNTKDEIAYILGAEDKATIALLTMNINAKFYDYSYSTDAEELAQYALDYDLEDYTITISPTSYYSQPMDNIIQILSPINKLCEEIKSLGQNK